MVLSEPGGSLTRSFKDFSQASAMTAAAMMRSRRRRRISEARMEDCGWRMVLGGDAIGLTVIADPIKL
ncbi:MAG: hypothetical protein DME97_14300 [Verrucomicrobia bacterium]|nr:MAG: hypothetical protein DME97_14300 [Verrucomicrobiota bacterium]